MMKKGDNVIKIYKDNEKILWQNKVVLSCGKKELKFGDGSASISIRLLTEEPRYNVRVATNQEEFEALVAELREEFDAHDLPLEEWTHERWGL